MIRLSDLWAPPWRVEIHEHVYEMKPLSLETFAGLEAAGVTLSRLTSQKSAPAWLDLFCYLAGISPNEDRETILANLLKDPLGLKRFQETVLESLAMRSEVKKQAVRRRQVKNPLEAQNGDSDREEEDEAAIDMSYLLSLSRHSGISLADLSRMSFRGISGLSKWLEENPPQPQMPMMPFM